MHTHNQPQHSPVYPQHSLMQYSPLPLSHSPFSALCVAFGWCLQLRPSGGIHCSQCSEKPSWPSSRNSPSSMTPHAGHGRAKKGRPGRPPLPQRPAGMTRAYLMPRRPLLTPGHDSLTRCKQYFNHGAGRCQTTRTARADPLSMSFPACVPPLLNVCLTFLPPLNAQLAQTSSVSAPSLLALTCWKSS